MNVDPEAVTAYIEQHCENQPPNEPKDPATLFQDFDEDSLDPEIADLWRWGIVEVSWNDDEGEQYINLSEFGVELHEKGLAETYIRAKNGSLDLDGSVNTGAVRFLE